MEDNRLKLPSKPLSAGFSFVFLENILHVQWSENEKVCVAKCDTHADMACGRLPPSCATYLPADWPCECWPLGLDRPRIERWIDFAVNILELDAEHIKGNDSRIGWRSIFGATNDLLLKANAFIECSKNYNPGTRLEALDLVTFWKRCYKNAHKSSPTHPMPTGTGGPRKKEEKTSTFSDPFFPLTSWNDILAALNELSDDAKWKNDEPTRNKIRKLNTEHNGPIDFPAIRGAQPSVGKSALLNWWNGLRDTYDTRKDMAKTKAKSTRLTVEESHPYNANETVLPGIAGSVKRRRGKSK